jgi:pimeloyl-ACP methyl ester carboxylesterase
VAYRRAVAVAELPLRARSGDVELAGSLWLPRGEPVATLLMHPGSGRSTRHNDVYFPEIRLVLLRAGVAVASFDKRGVGGSTGDWASAGIVEQADDAIAALDELAALGVAGPLGLFGHSQGGWVVIEAAGRAPGVDFVIANSGPGVPPAVQDRFSLGNALRRRGLTDEELATRLAAWDAMAAMLRGGASYDDARQRVEAMGGHDVVGFIADDAVAWELSRKILDHDPRPAMQHIEVPTLAMFGADDEVVPVGASVDVFRAEIRPDLLTVAVLPGGDHRVQAGDPPRLVDGYAEALLGFVGSV